MMTQVYASGRPPPGRCGGVPSCENGKQLDRPAATIYSASEGVKKSHCPRYRLILNTQGYQLSDYRWQLMKDAWEDDECFTVCLAIQGRWKKCE
ncbi:hypothetical protein [Paeniglutamicibacter sp.]|uniref:hypothetical protein n=1 Tax=Paeniglutamicibacter sp. TaxID=1934391 RepID=UPI003988E0E8